MSRYVIWYGASRFTGHPAQAAFVACHERFSLYVGGVGAGKTTAPGVVEGHARRGGRARPAIELPG